MGNIELARAAYQRMAWREAYDRFVAADQETPLPLDDLELAATSAQLTAHDAEADEFWGRCVQVAEHAELPARAALSATWLGTSFLNRGDMARASGWLARARGLADAAPDSVVHGFLMLPPALQALFGGGDLVQARAGFADALQCGQRFGDVELMTLSRLGLGQVLLRLDEAVEGLALLDQAMVAVTTGEVRPLVAGIVYCATIAACHSIFDVGRAREWTEALTKWCDAQPELVPFRGQCLVHRAEILRLRGAWSDAMTEAERARQHLEGHVDIALADAWYEQAELHRLRGRFADAEAAYRLASEHGREPQPGLALLRLGQGQVESAHAAIRRVIEEPHDPIERAGRLAAFVEIMLAVDDVAAARPAAAELAIVAEHMQSPFLRAASAYASGAIALADGDAAAALAPLRHAWHTWCDVDAPYDAARARVLIGVACRDLGDDDTATMEFDAARRAFDVLGATPDIERLNQRTASEPAVAPGGLTGREVEVLELVAAGKTNRQIAEALVISEKTVARHVSNIFTKLGLSSRAAATAYAYQHGLA